MKPGDAVAGLGGGAFATHVVVDAELVAPLPSALGVESAAAVPVAFLTAYYGLIACAGSSRMNGRSFMAARAASAWRRCKSRSGVARV